MLKSLLWMPHDFLSNERIMQIEIIFEKLMCWWFEKYTQLYVWMAINLNWFLIETIFSKNSILRTYKKGYLTFIRCSVYMYILIIKKSEKHEHRSACKISKNCCNISKNCCKISKNCICDRDCRSPMIPIVLPMLLSIIQPTKIDLSWQVFEMPLTLKLNVPRIALKINVDRGNFLQCQSLTSSASFCKNNVVQGCGQLVSYGTSLDWTFFWKCDWVSSLRWLSQL